MVRLVKAPIAVKHLKTIGVRSCAILPLEPILYTSEILGRMGTSFGCSDFWDCLGEQALIMIGRWYPKATINQSEARFVHPNDRRNHSLRKHPFFLALRRWGRSSARNVPSYEERGQTDVFAGYRNHRAESFYPFYFRRWKKKTLTVTTWIRAIGFSSSWHIIQGAK